MEFVEGWDLLQTLGEGAFGEVQLIVNRSTQEAVAVKVLHLDKVPGSDEIVRKEICIHKMVIHPNIIQYFGQRRDGNRQFIFLQYASGGELFDRIEPDLGMPEVDAQSYFQQLIAGVEYLHGRGIAHRDLKPENLLLDENENLKISDFGMATVFRHKGKERPLTKRCGTLPYIAPEVLVKEYYAEPADVWSCGVILVALVAGELPWDRPSYDCKEFCNWKECNLKMSPWTKLNDLLVTLLRKILMPMPTKRYTIPQIQKHLWFIKNLKHKTVSRSWLDVGDTASRKRFRCDSDTVTRVAEGCVTRLSNSQPEPQRSYKDAHGVTERLPNPAVGDQTRGLSFSQPVNPENLIISTQMMGNTTCTQLSASQTPLQKLVKRMTRFFAKTNLKDTLQEVKNVLDLMGYSWKEVTPSQITVTTKDRRKMQLIFKAFLLEMNESILVDFRLSRGDGLEFKRHFLKLKEHLHDIVSKGPITWPIAIATNTLP